MTPAVRPVPVCTVVVAGWDVAVAGWDMALLLAVAALAVPRRVVMRRAAVRSMVAVAVVMAVQAVRVVLPVAWRWVAPLLAVPGVVVTVRGVVMTVGVVALVG